MMMMMKMMMKQELNSLLFEAGLRAVFVLSKAVALLSVQVAKEEQSLVSLLAIMVQCRLSLPHSRMLM